MKKNWHLYTLSIIVFIIVFLVISSSGSLFDLNMYSNHEDRIPTNNILAFEHHQDDIPTLFKYTEDKTKGNYIHLENQFPIEDEIGMQLEGEYKEFNFKLELNEKAKGVRYYITVEKLVNSDFDENYVKIYLDNEGKLLNECLRETGRIKTFNEYDMYNGKKDERIIYSGTIKDQEAQRGYKSFTFKMWVSEDLVKNNEDYLSQTFVARINVHATGKL